MSTSVQAFRGSYLLPSFEKATVADVMRPGVMSCSPDVPAVMVARMMATHHIHAVVVEAIADPRAEDEAALWGVVSDMDLLHGARSGIEGLTARELAATEPVTIRAAAPLAEAVQVMEEHDVTHLVVVDAGRPAGVLSTLDVAGVLAWGRA
jgi:arabinose-5-phosphate isomerase